MYASKNFTEEEMMKYNMIPTNKKDDWMKTPTYFTNLYAMQKTYSEDHATESGFTSAYNITHIDPVTSVGHASINLNRGSAIGTPEYEATTAYHDYVEELEESLSGTKEYAANISTAENDQTITALCSKQVVQQKQTDTALQ